MPVGLHISGELLERLVTSGCSPLQILLAGEIAQFGEGQCYAQAKHFAKRFGRPKSTIVDALKGLRGLDIIADDGDQKRLLSPDEARTENTAERTKNTIDRTKRARTEKATNRTEKSIDRTDSFAEREFFRSPSEVRKKKQETKIEETKKVPPKKSAAAWDRKNDPLWNPTFDAIVTVTCSGDLLKRPKGSPAGLIAQTTDILRMAGHTADQVLAFPGWWRNDRMSFKRSCPTVLQIRDNLHLSLGQPTSGTVQSALPLNAPSTVEPPAPTSTLPAGLKATATELAWWCGCLGKIADSMNAEMFRDFIGCLELEGIEDGTVHLTAPDRFARANALWHTDTMAEVAGKPVKIHVREWSFDE